MITKTLAMRAVLLTTSILVCALTMFASEIRDFDLKTIERLGNELTRVTQAPDKGATSLAKKKAKQTAIAALNGKLFDLRYDYVVLDDPDGNGFLVYALGAARKANEVVLAGHFRVTVSPDGEKAERIDALSRTKNVVPWRSGAQALWIIQLVSNKPVETFIYLSNFHHSPIYVGTPDRTIWKVDRGKVQIIRDKKDAPRATNR